MTFGNHPGGDEYITFIIEPMIFIPYRKTRDVRLRGDFGNHWAQARLGYKANHPPYPYAVFLSRNTVTKRTILYRTNVA